MVNYYKKIDFICVHLRLILNYYYENFKHCRRKAEFYEDCSDYWGHEQASWPDRSDAGAYWSALWWKNEQGFFWGSWHAKAGYWPWGWSRLTCSADRKGCCFPNTPLADQANKPVGGNQFLHIFPANKSIRYGLNNPCLFISKII